MERAMGIEPTSEAWEASILPLYDARSTLWRGNYTQEGNCSYRLDVLPRLQTAWCYFIRARTLFRIKTGKHWL
jgi:hypothetical protein